MSDTDGQQPTTPGASRSPRLVVGVDGSDHSREALVWALTEAARRTAALDVVTTFPVDVTWADTYLLDSHRIDTIRTDTEARARAFVDEVRAAPEVAGVPGVGDVPLTMQVLAGPAAEQLVDRSEAADLLVVGSRGRGAVRSTVLGSVALHCSVHAHCPVVVVRPGRQPEDGPVVVGLEDSPAGRAALQTAAGEAQRRGSPLEAVIACVPVDTWSDTYTLDPKRMRANAQRFAQQFAEEVLGSTPGLDVRVVADVGPADEVLVHRAKRAALLVVGSRSRSRLVGMVLGSVALRTVVHAPCPVMVVHPPQAGATDAPAETADAVRS